jgi:hypothetical protein
MIVQMDYYYIPDLCFNPQVLTGLQCTILSSTGLNCYEKQNHLKKIKNLIDACTVLDVGYKSTVGELTTHGHLVRDRDVGGGSRCRRRGSLPL